MRLRFWNTTNASVGGVALLIGIASIVSRLFGILRDRLLSGTFGAGADLDAYYAAFRIPDMVYGMVVGGVVTAGFIPVFTRYLGKDASPARGINEGAARLVDLLLTLLGALLAVFAVVGFVTAPWFVPRLTPGFDPENIVKTVLLTRVMFFSPILLGISNVFGGILQTKRRFLVFAFAPVLYNLGTIMGTVFLAPTMGILGSAIGVVSGAFLHLVAQMAACHDAGYRYRPLWARADDGIKQIVKLTIPRLASLGSAQINFIIITGIASTLGAGSIAIFTLANNLQQFPISIIGVSFGVAAFPLIAELASQGKHREFAEAIARATSNILFLIIPATVLMLLLRAQIVRVVLGAGHFDWADTVATADTLAFFSLSLFSQALWPLLARACFALEDGMSPLYAVVVGIFVERSSAWAFVRHGMGTAGLALAFSMSSVFVICWIWIAVRRKVGTLGEPAIIRSAAITTAAALCMAVAVQVTKTWVGTMLGTDTFFRVLAQGAGAGVAGIIVFIGVAYLLGSKEARSILVMSHRKFATLPVSDIRQEDGSIVP
jgi:putative peptidoglycan lipid II flippase